MSYVKSSSRTAFEGRIDGLRKSAKVASTKSRKIPREVRDLAFHAAILETSAALEEYIKNLLEDYAYRSRSIGLQMGRLPQSVRTFLLIHGTLPHFENLALSRDERRALEKLDINGKAFSVLDPTAPIGRDVNIGALLDKKKYPSPKNWITLFCRLGIKDIFAAADVRLKRDTKLLLQSFNDVRTALAHGEAPSLTYDDVVRHLGNMKCLVGAVDRVLFSHLCSHSGKPSWPS